MSLAEDSLLHRSYAECLCIDLYFCFLWFISLFNDTYQIHCHISLNDKVTVMRSFILNGIILEFDRRS
jgi:hypothetical protein